LQLHSKNRQVPLTVHNKQLSGAQALAVFSDSTSTVIHAPFFSTLYV